MALYYLSYDLRKNKDYQSLFEELKRFGAVRILKSEWCFHRIDTSVANLREHFRGFVDHDDGLSIAEVTYWATYNTEGSPNEL